MKNSISRLTLLKLLIARDRGLIVLYQDINSLVIEKVRLKERQNSHQI